MNENIILSAIAVFAFTAISAQEAKFGVKAGANSGSLTGDIDRTKSRIGFDLGFFSEILISEKFTIRPELLYSAQVYKVNKNSTSLNYIVFPVMANLFIAKSFSLEAGPQIGFLTSAKTKFDDGNADSKDFYKDVKDSYEPINFGLNLGVGYDLTPNVSVGFRYNLGLSDIINNEAGNKNYKSEDVEFRNNVLSISLIFKYL